MALKRESGSPIEPRGNKEERQAFTDVHAHYVTAKEDLEQRITRKNGFDDADKFFAGHIDENDWPYRSIMFDPRPYTVILEKSARLVGSKPKGRVIPRENGDTLGAKICNELLGFQWEDNGRLGRSMIEKWIEMDQNARKYGAGFGLAKWVYKTQVKSDGDGKGKRKVFYDGPDFVVCNPRDVLANPSYSNINKWFQHREYVTLEELLGVNDIAKGKPVYKNLDIIRQQLREDDEAKGKGDRQDVNYTSQNKSMRGLTNYLGSDEVYKTLEMVTEYRPDRWITFVPKHGVVIRDIPNPYEHGEIPVVMLKYYPLPDDLYGVNEYEPVSKLIRGINSLFSQYIDNIAIDLYPPLMINPINVRMHTIEFTQEAKWLMNQPGVDVKRLETSTAATNNFQAAYSIMVSSLLNAWGETSQGISNIDPFSQNKTATEVRDSAFTRNVRDNMNQIFLSEAIKKQTMFWLNMNRQYLFKGSEDQVKVVRIVGRDALDYFKGQGMADIRPTEEDAEKIALGMQQPEDVVPGPVFPVERGGEVSPKLMMDETGNSADLLIEEGDVMGSYDYIPDIESMQAPSQEQTEQKLQSILGVLTNPVILQMLQQEQKRPKVMELLVKLFESTRVIKDAEAYFEDIEENVQEQTNQGGAPAPAAGPMGPGDAGVQGMAGGNQAVPGGQGPQLVG